MGISCVKLKKDGGEETKLDLRYDTVAPETLGFGVTAHDRKGNPIVGNATFGEYALYGTYVLKKAYNLYDIEQHLAFGYETVYSHFYTENGWEYAQVEEIYLSDCAEIYSEELGTSNSYDALEGGWFGEYGDFPDDRYLIIDFVEKQVVPKEFYNAFLMACEFRKETSFQMGQRLHDEYILYGTYMFRDGVQVESDHDIELIFGESEVYSWFSFNSNFVYDKVGKITIGQQDLSVYNEDYSYSNTTWGGEWLNQDDDVLTNGDQRYKIIDFRLPVKVSKEFYDFFDLVVDNDDFTPYDIGHGIGYDDGWYVGYQEGYNEAYDQYRPSGTLNITSNGTRNVSTYEYVNVNVSVSSGVDGEALLYGSITAINSTVARVKAHTCRTSYSLKTVNLPNCTQIGTYAFEGCTGLTSFVAPKLSTMATYAFYGCSALPSINLPLASTLPTSCFYNCKKLEVADFGVASNMYATAFYNCAALTTLILRRTSAICTLANTSAFTGTPIASGTGYVYVPKALIDTYKSATNWSTYANQFRAIEDYPDIVGA